MMQKHHFDVQISVQFFFFTCALKTRDIKFALSVSHIKTLTFPSATCQLNTTFELLYGYKRWVSLHYTLLYVHGTALHIVRPRKGQQTLKIRFFF